MKNEIKVLRKAKGVRQSDMAEAIGVARATIIAIENNQYNPSLELAFKIADYFGKSIHDIFQPKPMP